MAVIVIIVISFFVLLIKVNNKQKHLSGEGLENRVSTDLTMFQRDGGQVIQNCYLKWSNGSTTQIDNILITRKGIFVIECKDYRGWIFGNDINNHWTETYLSGNKRSEKHTFYNPIKQNREHIHSIRYKLKDYSVPIYSIVVFSNQCEFKNITNNTITDVIKERLLVRTITHILNTTDEVLSSIEVDNYRYILETDVSDKDLIRSEHIRNTERVKFYKEEERNNRTNTCPRCGYPLVLRDGQYGQFYGCSRYPNCKYTKKQGRSFNGKQ